MEKDNLPIKTKNIAINDRVIIVFHKDNPFDKGTVRFIGPIQGSEAIYYGIELDEEKGKHDGKGLFTTPTNKATIVMLKHLRKLVGEEFNLRDFKKRLAAEKKSREKEKIVKKDTPKSDLPQISEEVEREVEQTSATLGSNAEIEELNKKLKMMESGYKELLQKKEADIIKLTNKVRSTEEKMEKELREMAKKMTISESAGKVQAEMHKMEEKMSNLVIELESLKEELSITNQILEEKELQIEELEIDKQIMQEEANLTAEETEDNIDPEELRKNYGLVKLAFLKLKDDYDRDSLKWENEKEILSGNKSKNALDSEEVKKLLQQKDDIIVDLKSRLEEYSDSEKYILNLTDQILNKENRVTELEISLREVKANLKVSEEIGEEFEELNNILSEELEIKEEDINALLEESDTLKEEIKEKQQIIQKYRDRLANVQGEIDIIKTQSLSSGGEAKVDKIDNLIKCYTASLSDKRSLVKQLVLKNTREAREAKKQRKWAIVSKALPETLLEELNLPLVEKFLNIKELSEKIDIVLSQFITNYLKNRGVFTENPELIDFILKISTVLVETKTMCLYLFDFGFTLGKTDEFRSFLKSSMFLMIKSIEMLIERLITEVREDSFSTKFNYGLLEENKTKIMTTLRGSTNEFELLPNRNAIDNVSNTQLIYMNFLALHILTTEGGDPDPKLGETERKLEMCYEFAIMNQNWPVSAARLLNIESIDPDAFIEGDTQRVLSVVTQAWNVIRDQNNNAKDCLNELVLKLESYLSKYGKKAKKDEDLEIYLIQIIEQHGPWQEGVKKIRSQLNDFDKLRSSCMTLESQMAEIKVSLTEKEQTILNADKVRAALETRTKELEFRCQVIPNLENEKRRLSDKERHYAEACKRLEQENAHLKEKIKNGPKNYSSTNPGDGQPAMANKMTKRLQDAVSKLNRIRIKPTSKQLKDQNYTYIDKNEVGCLAQYVNKLSDQLTMEKASKTESMFLNIQGNMPFFKRYMDKVQMKSGQGLHKTGTKSLNKVNSFASAIRSGISGVSIVDCTPKENEGANSRILRLTQAISKQETLVNSCLFKAKRELDEFRSKWANYHLSNCEHMNVSADIKKIIQETDRKVIGTASLVDRLEGTTESQHKVAFDRKSFRFEQAIKF